MAVTVQMRAASRAASRCGSVGVFPGHDGAAQRSFGGVVVEPIIGNAVGGEAVPFAVQGGERLLCRFLQAGGGHLGPAGLVMTAIASSRRRWPRQRAAAAAASAARGPQSPPRGHELRVGRVQVLDPLQPRCRPVRQLGGVRIAGPHEIPPDVRPAVKIDQPAGFFPADW